MPVVGVGASAGGLGAFEAFFSGIPDQPTGMAFVLVQHLAPDHHSILSELVGRFTIMPVLEVQDGMAIQPDCVYIIPPNRDMALLNGTLHLFEQTLPRGLRMPIDFFFRSLAQDQRERAICIILSGTGSDGTLGLRMVKGEGGMAMAQSPESVQYDGMPRSAIQTGLVDYVLPPEAMYARLEAYVGHAFRTPKFAPSPEGGTPFSDALKKIFVLLRAQTSHDFSNYKESTIRRRVERRMAIHQLLEEEEYLRLLRGSPEEVEALFRDFLIGVTGFFRDPAAFQALQEEAIPALLDGKPQGASLRIWVCGCSTGEEAYSIALLIQEHLEEHGMSLKIQIFGTDLDRLAIETARSGVFPASIAADVPAPFLKRYFQQDQTGHFQITKGIRDLLIFSEQDVIKDPPFSRVDLISCRNLLIYMNAELQKRILPLFAYALRPNGFLFLGTAESIGGFGTLFAPVNRKQKLYRRREEPVGHVILPLGDTLQPPLPPPGFRKARAAEAEGDFRSIAEQALLGHYVQAGILVSSTGEILHLVGRSGRFLEPPSGEPAMNILCMAREGLREELNAAFARVVAHKAQVDIRGLRVLTEGGEILVNLCVVPAQAFGNAYADMYLVTLEEVSPGAPERGGGEADPETVDRRIEGLKQELRAKDENLRTALEEMGTSNEELKSTNEEVQSVNEELHSTNEELEASKEELQSVNEELATVNAELQSKVLDLSRASNDMNNLLSSTGVGVLVLDNNLRVSRFTPAIAQVINLLPSDVGRAVSHFAPNLPKYGRLMEDLRAVLATLVPREVEVQALTGSWYLMRIHPYRSAENLIEGLVLTCVDITGYKRSEAP